MCEETDTHAYSNFRYSTKGGLIENRLLRGLYGSASLIVIPYGTVILSPRLLSGTGAAAHTWRLIPDELLALHSCKRSSAFPTFLHRVAARLCRFAHQAIYQFRPTSVIVRRRRHLQQQQQQQQQRQPGCRRRRRPWRTADQAFSHLRRRVGRGGGSGGVAGFLGVRARSNKGRKCANPRVLEPGTHRGRKFSWVADA